MGYHGMSGAEIKREIKQAAAEEDWQRFGPRCWTCRSGVNFSAKEYPYALAKDATYCKRWADLMEGPHHPSEELDCWEG